jgi:hypothetical protein
LEIHEALSAILAGRAIIFTGAGFSRGAVNLRNEEFKTGGPFAAHLAKQVGLPDTTGLEDAAEWFVEKLGQSRLIEELQQEFTTKQVSPGQIEVLSHPWRRLYTTNYDNVAETSAAQSGKHLVPATLSDALHTLPRTGTLAVHLNGLVTRLNATDVNSDVKLTDTSYLTNTVAASSWATTLRQDMDAARAVFFVGYSTADIDIRRLLYDRPSLKEKCFFILGSGLDAVTKQKIERFGTVLDMDLNAFAAALKKAALTFSTHTTLAPLNYSVRPFQPPIAPSAFDDRAIFDLFLHGDIRTEYVWQSLHGHLPYFVESSVAKNSIAYFENDYRAVTISSDLGNGKTSAVAALRVYAYDAGYDVFDIATKSETLYEELLEVFKSTRKTLLVLEQYADWLDAIDFFGKNAPKNCVIALSARTSIHDVLVDRIADRLKPGKLAELSADTLLPAECEQVVELFNRYGLWGDLAAKSKTFKVNHISRTCQAQWHAILIDRFNAPQIRQRFSPIIEALSKKKRFYEVVMAILVLNVLDYEPTIDLLITLCGEDVLNQEFKRDPSVQELLDASSGRIRLRSSIAGQFILTQFADPNATVTVLSKMAKAADISARGNPRHFEILKSLMRFHNLQDLFPEQDRRRAFIRYYESIKDLSHTRTNPLFWLQYAIACTVLEDFERAETYFATAYSLAEARDNFDAYQIDNHYGRFLLMRAIRGKDGGKYMKSFRDARKLIFEQIQTERRHYPFRVATLIGEFYDTFVSVMSANDKQEVARAAKHIADRIELLPRSLQEHRNVLECRAAMRHILDLG